MSALKVRTSTGPDVWTVVAPNTPNLKVRTATGPDVWTPAYSAPGKLKVRTATGPDRWASVIPGLPAPLLAYNFAESGTTVTDRSGNGRDAVMLAGSTPTDLHSGGEFVPTVANHRIKYTADSPALPTAACSVTAKFRILTAVGSAGGVIWGKYRSADSSSFNIYIQGSALNAVVRGAGGADVLTYTPLTNSTTYQVAVTNNGSRTTLFVNGLAHDWGGFATGGLDMSGTGDALTWQSGDHTLDSSITFAASFVVDDVRLYDVALSDAEVAVLAATPVT